MAIRLLKSIQFNLIKSNFKIRQLSSKSFDLNHSLEKGITLTDDGQTIVCWHPPEIFPYEHSMPYTERTDNCDAVLTSETLEKGHNINHKMPISRLHMEELQQITYTAKHQWRRRRFDGLKMKPDHPRRGV
ncbi:hypothetical protein SSS_01202 [Sarcoptes scabiei]|uniref:Large ribosomal subunit protein mL42 n=1 Tax=Sarcoptes scabiei TaxID=52283 RepID=A0A834VDK7_SARSC|nr:hypothetical protein SSS_01202 [Sarcoptes scabiei]UXI15112.1 hyccin [Sarcoptes scabiei]